METLKKRLTRRDLFKLATGVAGAGLTVAVGCQSTPPAPQPAAKPAEKAAAAPAQQPAEKAASAPVQGGELRYANRAEANTLDPHVGNTRDEARTILQIYDFLVFSDRAGKLYPWLATEWQASEDARSWTFKLRQGVKFHDGTPFNAEAVKANFDRMVNPTTKSRKSIVLMGPYAGSEVVDPYTIKVNFKRSYGPFPYLMTDPYAGIVSPTAALKAGPADFGKAPVGSGPFRFKEWVLKDRIVLERNPDYNWASPGFKHQGPAYLDRIVVRPIPEDATRVAALESGQVDVVDNLPTPEYPRLKADPKYAIVLNAVQGIPPQGHINVEKYPTDDLKVRQAILYGHSSEEISKVAWNGAYPPAYGPFSRADRFYDATVEKMYPHDKQKAEALLQEAGWKKGSDGIYAKDGKPLLLIYVTQPMYVAPAEVFLTQMLAIGIKVEIKQASSPAIDVMRQSGEHNVCWDGAQVPDVSGTARQFHSSSIGVQNNFNRYRGKDLDALLEAGEAEKDEPKRAKIYSDFQKLYMEKALSAPLYEGTQIFAMRPEVQGFGVQAVGEYPWLYDTYLKK